MGTYRAVLQCHAGGDWSNDDIEVDQRIGHDNREMPPPVREKLWQTEGSHLASTSTETKENVSKNGLAKVVRRSSDDGTDNHENIAKENKVTSPECITVGAEDHEGNRSVDAVDGCQPCSLGR